MMQKQHFHIILSTLLCFASLESSEKTLPPFLQNGNQTLVDAESEVQSIRELLEIGHWNTAAARCQQLISTLNTSPMLHKDLLNDLNFLLATCDALQGNYKDALPLYNQCLQSIKEIGSLRKERDIRVNLGIAHFYLNEFDKAQQQLLLASKTPDESREFLLAQLYLARIALETNNYDELDHLLNSLERQIPKNHLLRYELASLHGKTLFKRQDFHGAAQYFEQAVPKHHAAYVDWYCDTLYHLGLSYCQGSYDPSLSIQQQADLLTKGEQAFKKLIDQRPLEQNYMALGRCYLMKGKLTQDSSALVEAGRIFAQASLFQTAEATNEAQLLRAQAGATYLIREKLYLKLIQQETLPSEFVAKAWYWRGLNDYEEGERLAKEGREEEAQSTFAKAKQWFSKAFELSLSNDKPQASLALKFQALASFHQNEAQGHAVCFSTLEKLIRQYPDLLLATKDPDEIFFLCGQASYQIASHNQRSEYINQAKKLLREGIDRFPQGNWADRSLELIATIEFESGNYEEAARLFEQLAALYPSSPRAGNALFWQAHCFEQCGNDPMKIRHLKQQVYESYPSSPLAAEAYFFVYSFRDYLQGDREAIKHLRGFAARYPESPLIINALYLIGLDATRDRKSPEGKRLSRKNLTQAIESFVGVETAFDKLAAAGKIPSDQWDNYVFIRYRSMLDRAHANLAIGKASSGSKSHIYLEYAAAAFRQLLEEFDRQDNPLILSLKKREPYPSIQEEGSYWLAQALLEQGHIDEAKNKLHQMIDQYKNLKITRGYFLAKVWCDLAKAAFEKKAYAEALQAFAAAEDAARGKLLSTDERLNLWIQQSECHEAMGAIDQSILILSKVINDEAISGLRLKAMFLRAEAYEKQGRPELARKQLDALAKKGGQWGQKAKTKLIEDYGNL